MDTLHKRLTFKISDDHLGLPEEDTRILDEQGLTFVMHSQTVPMLMSHIEQEEIVQRLRQANTASNRQYLNFLRVILSLSFFLCVSVSGAVTNSSNTLGTSPDSLYRFWIPLMTTHYSRSSLRRPKTRLHLSPCLPYFLFFRYCCMPIFIFLHSRTT